MRTITSASPALVSTTSRPSIGLGPAQVLADDVGGHFAIVMELKHLARRTGGVAESQPIGLGDDGAIDHAAAVIEQMQRKLRRRAVEQLAEVEFQRLHDEAGGEACRAGQLLKQLIEAAIVVVELGRLPGRVGEIGPADGVEETAEKAAAQHVLAGLPIVFTREDQFVEVAAVATGGENERMRERLPADGQRRGQRGVEGSAVVVAVQRLPPD